MARKTLLKIDYKLNKIIKRYCNALVQEKIPFDKIILFGSRAKGISKPWSDIDLCIVSNTFGKNRFDERIKLMKIACKIETLIEPIPYHPDDLKNKFDPLAAEIRKSKCVVSAGR